MLTNNPESHADPRVSGRPLKEALKAPHPARGGGETGSAAAGGFDLGIARKPAERFFRKGESTIDRDLENAVGALDQFDLGIVTIPPHQNVPRTEGARFVVSPYAVFDPDLHGPPRTTLPRDSSMGGMAPLSLSRLPSADKGEAGSGQRPCLSLFRRSATGRRRSAGVSPACGPRLRRAYFTSRAVWTA
jgi:hypothetical protein